MTQCKTCLYHSNHPLGITFKNEICSGCTYHLEKNQIDWNFRRKLLGELLKDYRSNNSNYDCIVPVSGGQDSFYLVHLVVNVLKLRPYLVSFNRTFNTRIGLANLARLRTVFDCDFQQLSPSLKLAKSMLTTSIENLGSTNWFWIAGQTSYPVRIAVEKKIPLIIWGAHQGNEQTGMFSHHDYVEMTRRYRREHDLMGVDEVDFLEFDSTIRERDLSLITYPSDKEIIDTGTRGIYLSNYFRWDPVDQHNFVNVTYKCIGAKLKNTYYGYDNPDCEFYNTIHDKLKFIKHGYMKVTDQLVRDIRHGRVTKEKAIDLQNRFQNRELHFEHVAKWLGMDTRAIFLIFLSFQKDYNKSIFEDYWANIINKNNNFSAKVRNYIMQSKFNSDLDQNLKSFGRGKEYLEIE
jgi:N-acetyl sugar amidotransferase